jgi:hypothetical protein
MARKRSMNGLKTRALFLLGALSLLGLTLSACGKSDTAESGETHFLSFCDDDECGDGMTCVCGVCTTECTDSSDCGGLASGARCRTLSQTCDGVANSCDVTCDGDEDCAELGSDYSCLSGSCRKGELPEGCAPGCDPVSGNPVNTVDSCLDLGASEVLGCSCGEIGPVAIGTVCRRRVSDGAVFSVPNRELVEAAEFEDCSDADRESMAISCDFSSCASPPPSSCSLSETCSLINCGNSIFDENGCHRPNCEGPEDCAANEECVEVSFSPPIECNTSSGQCRCGTLLGTTTASFCNPKPPVMLGELCDGSDEVRLVMGSGGGFVDDSYEFVTPDGEYVLIDGQCRYYVVGADPSRIPSGTLDAAQADALATGVGWENFATWTPYIDQESCPDAGSAYMIAPDVVLTCTCGCDLSAPAGLEDAMTQAYEWRNTSNEEGTPLRGLTLRAVARLATLLSDPGDAPILDWTLDIPLSELLLPESEPYQRDSGIAIDDPTNIGALLALREASGLFADINATPGGYVFVEDDTGTRYGVLVRAELPGTLGAEVTTLRESAFR